MTIRNNQNGAVGQQSRTAGNRTSGKTISSDSGGQESGGRLDHGATTGAAMTSSIVLTSNFQIQTGNETIYERAIWGLNMITYGAISANFFQSSIKLSN